MSGRTRRLGGRAARRTPQLPQLSFDALIEALIPYLSPAAATAVGGVSMTRMADRSAVQSRSATGRHRAGGVTPPVGPVGPVAPAPEPAKMEDDHEESWRLVKEVQAGNGEAFGLLYDRYFDIVFRFIYYRVGDRGLAEDFTSETFLRGLRRMNGLSYQGRDVGAWFITIARNIVFDHSKSARHRLEHTTGEIIEDGSVAASTEALVLESLTNRDLLAAVNRLNPEQRECVVLRFMQGLSVSETAQAMGKNDGAIKALQHRAVRKLADLVGGELRD